MYKRVVLLTKDAMCKDYLPVYGGKQWMDKTPNMCELAEKGTVFYNYYTVAPSTAMSFLGMFTGKYPYELDLHDYTPMQKEFQNNIFRKLNKMGYACHIIWDSKWDILAKPYSNCYGKSVFHSLENIGQPVGARFQHKEPIKPDDNKKNLVLKRIEDEIKSLNDEKLFLWIHMPHVINGRVSYGGDIDVFDSLIGIVRKYFSDDSIYISADHGNMNGSHGKVGYGFDIYQPAICIPLITPRLRNQKVYKDLFSSVDLGNMIMTGEVNKRDCIFVDTAYYKQPHRKLAIIHNNYKYIFNKKTNTEEIYDLEYDNNEGINLIQDLYYDLDRKTSYPLKELLSYDRWDDLKNEISYLRHKKDEIWRQESSVEHIYWTLRHSAGEAIDKAQIIKESLLRKI